MLELGMQTRSHSLDPTYRTLKKALLLILHTGPHLSFLKKEFGLDSSKKFQKWTLLPSLLYERRANEIGKVSCFLNYFLFKNIYK
jgi:hypothetical protein